MVSDLQVTFVTVDAITFADPMKELHKNIVNPSEQVSKKTHVDCTSHSVSGPDQSETT